MKVAIVMRRLLLSLSLLCVLIPGTPPKAERMEASALADVQDDGSALPDDTGMERLARTDPLAFFRECLIRYDREVRGYTCILEKQERLGGRLQDPEAIHVAFREQPFSVLLEWKKEPRRAQRVLYVRGENKDRLLVKPAGRFLSLVGVITRDPEGPDARSSGRYPLTEFGIKIGTQRTLGAMEKAKKQNALHVEYLGQQRVKELNGRLCYVLRRTGYKRPEEDGITELTVYVDKETWLQTGSVLRGKANGVDGQLLGSYFFRDVRVNPPFPPDTFTRAAVAR